MLLRDFADQTPFELTMADMVVVTVTEITEEDDDLIVCFHKSNDPEGVIRIMALDLYAEANTDCVTSLN